MAVERAIHSRAKNQTTKFKSEKYKKKFVYTLSFENSKNLVQAVLIHAGSMLFADKLFSF